MYCCGKCTCGKCGEEGIACTVAVNVRAENAETEKTARTSAKIVRAENAEKKESHVLLR